MVALDADTAQRWAVKEGKQTIMVPSETKPDDMHGMLAAKGILTSLGGRTSHAALGARQVGKPTVVGVASLKINPVVRQIEVNDQIIKVGDWLSIDGTVGEIYTGKLATIVPEVEDPWLVKLLAWADDFRHLSVWVNADRPEDAKRGQRRG